MIMGITITMEKMHRRQRLPRQSRLQQLAFYTIMTLIKANFLTRQLQLLSASLHVERTKVAQADVCEQPRDRRGKHPSRSRPSPLIFSAVLDKGLLAFLRCASKIPLHARVHVTQLKMERVQTWTSGKYSSSGNISRCRVFCDVLQLHVIRFYQFQVSRELNGARGRHPNGDSFATCVKLSS